MYDIIIVGAGPAGLSAAIYALRAKKKVLVIESVTYGGQIVTASKIENYPGIKSITGFEFATELYEQVKELGAEFKFETVTRIEEDKTVITNKDNYKARAIIIATGAKNRKLEVEDEDKYIGKGLSYCATCDGNFYKDKVVAIVGGGNTALEDALYLSDIAKKVYLIHRRSEFRGEDNYIEDIKSKNNIELVLDANVTKLYGEKKLESIDVKENENIINIVVDGLFIAIGQQPNNRIFTNIVELDHNGYIVTDETLKSKVDGIYVAGDNRRKSLRQLTTAVSDGSIAATNAMREMR